MFCGVPARSGHVVNFECLTNFSGSWTVSVRFGLHANIVEEYVLLSALLHNQCCLQSAPSFSASVLYGTLFLESLFARVGFMYM